VAADVELIRGTLDLFVLKTLTWGPMHGLGIPRWIDQVTDAGLQVEEGALYTALHRMEQRGLITGEWSRSENGRRARYYELTAAGRRAYTARRRPGRRPSRWNSECAFCSWCGRIFTHCP
jgi:transcriptional regulator